MCKILNISLLLALLYSSSAFAIEDLTLDSAISRPSTTKWRVDEVHIYISSQIVNVAFIDPQNIVPGLVCQETGAAAQTLIVNLNTANLTNNSLNRRIMNWAISKGCIGTGTISGTP